MFTTSVNGNAGLALDNALASWPKLSEFLCYKSFEVAPEGAMRT